MANPTRRTRASTLVPHHDPREGGVLALVLIAVLAVACALIFLRAKGAEEAAADRPDELREEAKPSPFRAVDAALADSGPSAAPDARAATVRMKIAEMKAERTKIDAAVRADSASVQSREADIARLRNDIADAKKRIARFKEKLRADPTDEVVKDRLYAVAVKLNGGEGVEGLETRLVRSTAALADAKELFAKHTRRLASIDSAIAIAESKGQTVVDYVRDGDTDVAVDKVNDAEKAVDGLEESTERTKREIGAESESARARRDATLKSLLEEP